MSSISRMEGSNPLASVGLMTKIDVQRCIILQPTKARKNTGIRAKFRIRPGHYTEPRGNEYSETPDAVQFQLSFHDSHRYSLAF